MIDIVGVCYRFFGELVHGLGVTKSIRTRFNPEPSPPKQTARPNVVQLNGLAAQALTAVFDMDAEGRIKKEKARRVVEKLGLTGTDEDGSSFDIVGSSEDEIRAEKLIGGLEEEDEEEEDGLRSAELLRRAFTVFDKDGDGFIEAMEVKRVLECLGLANGMENGEFEKMVEVVDLNFDGKVDFSEFELMMGEKM